jgi:Ser/Thr protein kinase RdoA (MazF antagonist)
MSDREFLHERQVSDILAENWGVNSAGAVFIPEGVSTLNWLVQTQEGARYILRDCGNYKDYTQFQCDVWHELGRSGFPYEIPRPLPTADGGHVARFEDSSSFILYPYIVGTTAKCADLQGQEIGHMLGSYHNGVAPMDWSSYAQLRSKELLAPDGLLPHIVDTVARIEGQGPKLEVGRTFLELHPEITGKFVGMLEALDQEAYASLPCIPCHGDYKPENLLTRGGRLVGLIDLGGVVIDPKILDVQNSIATAAFGTGGFDEPKVGEILKGYSEQSALASDEITLIAPLMYADVVRRMCWQLQELCVSQSRVRPEDAEHSLHDALTLGRLGVAETTELFLAASSG